MDVWEDSGFEARIHWLGMVPDRKAALASTADTRLILGFAGPEGEDHGGLTRPACSRVRNLYPRNAKIRNTRQLSILSREELDEIAAKMGLEALDPALVGATLVVEGIPDFSHIPPSSRLQAASGATLVIDAENQPCMLPARPIETAHPGFGKSFKSAAKGKRGVTAWVEREGEIKLGEALRLFVPSQRPWAPKRA